MSTYKPTLFEAIAKDVARGRSEQYVFAKKGINAPTLMFSTPALEDAIAAATAQVPDAITVLHAEYIYSKSITGDEVFADGCRSVLDVDGVLVELHVREIAHEEWRVLFAKVDAAKLYGTLTDRIASLEQSVSSLQRAVAEPA